MPTTLSARQIITHMQVPTRPRAFVLGCFEKRVTIHSQQVRALNLIFSLFEQKIVGDGGHLAVIGGGIAGMTAAAGAAKKGCKVTLLERRGLPNPLMRVQRDCNHRWIHSAIYDWPDEAALKPIPVLRWEPGLAQTVVKKLQERWDNLPYRSRITTLAGVKSIAWGPSSKRKIGLTWDQDTPQTGDFDAVIIAVGFGPERALKGIPETPYWTPDRLAMRREPGYRILISGCGDGGLTDFLRVLIDDFEHHEIVKFVNGSEFDGVKDELRQIEVRAFQRLSGDPGGDHSAELLSDYAALKHVPVGLDEELKRRLRGDVTVILNSRSASPLSLQASALNRFLSSRFITGKVSAQYDYKRGELTGIRPPRKGNPQRRVVFKDATELEVHEIVCRQGPDSALKTSFREIYEEVAPRLGTFKELDQTRDPMWDPEDWFGPAGDETLGPVASLTTSVAAAASAASATAAQPMPLMLSDDPTLRNGITKFFASYLGTPDAPAPFGGRQRELRQLEDWLGNPDGSSYLMLTAPTGIGKSALLVRWREVLAVRKDWAVIFLPISVRFGTNHKERILTFLVNELSILRGMAQPPSNPDPRVLVTRFAALLDGPLPTGMKALVILDGLDEAPDHPFELGTFPLKLPDGLRLVVSVRQRADDSAAQWKRRLGWDIPSHSVAGFTFSKLDLVGVAQALRSGGELTASLADRPEIVDKLVERTDGDPLDVSEHIISLRKLLESGEQITITTLEQLPVGTMNRVSAWFTEQRAIWGAEADQREQEAYHVLNVLAFAEGPLSEVELRELLEADSGDDAVGLRRVLNSLDRLILETDTGYVFSYNRFRDYFQDRLGAQEQLQVHKRFVSWGRRVLAQLGSEPASPRTTIPLYLMRHYVKHLRSAESPPEDYVATITPAWLRACESSGASWSSFVSAIHDTLNAAEKADHHQLIAHQPATCLGSALRCALLAASVNSLAQAVSPQLLAALVAKGIWSSAEGLACIQRMPDGHERGLAFDALIPWLQESQFPEALFTVRLLDPDDRADALIALTKRLPDSLLPEAFRLTAHFPERGHALFATARLLLRLPAEEREHRIAGLVQEAEALADDFQRAQALRELALGASPSEQPRLLHNALVAANRVEPTNDAHELRVLIALLPHLQGNERDRIAQQVLSSILEQEPVFWWWGQYLEALAPYLRVESFSKVLDKVEQIDSFRPGRKAKIIETIAQTMPDVLLPRALGLATRLAHVEPNGTRFRVPEIRAGVLHSLLPRLRGKDRDKAVAAVGAQTAGLAKTLTFPPRDHEDWQGSASQTQAANRIRRLLSLTRFLPNSHRAAAFDMALARSRELGEADAALEVLAELLALSDEPFRSSVQEEIIARVRKCDWNGRVLFQLRHHLNVLPADDLRKLLRSTQHIGDSESLGSVEQSLSGAVVSIAPGSLLGARPHELYKQVYTLTPRKRDKLLRQTEPDWEHLDHKQLRALLLAMPDKPRRKTGQRLRARLVGYIGKSEGGREWLVRHEDGKALRRSPKKRAALLSAIRDKKKIYEQAVDLVPLIDATPESDRDPLLQEALTLTGKLGNNKKQVEQILRLLMPYLAAYTDAIRRAQDLAMSHAEPEDRADALTSIISCPIEAIRREILMSTMETLEAVDNLRIVSPCVDRLAPYLNFGEVARAIDLIARVWLVDERETALAAVTFPISEFPPEQILALIYRWLRGTVTNQRVRPDLFRELGALAPAIGKLGGATMLTNFSQEIERVRVWYP